MPQQNIKFIAADMDGTLLNEHGKLDPEFFNLYERLEAQDIIFAAASGRQYYSLMETFSPLKNRMVFVAENGTLVMHKGQELYSCLLDTDAIKDIIKEARSIEGAHVVLCGKKSAYIETKDERALAEISKYYHRREQVEDLLAVEDDFIKVAICHFDGSQEKVNPTIDAKFGENYQVVVSAKIWLDVMNAEASKGAAIKHLQNTLGFTYEQTMSFGDYLNDLEMLKESYHSYAMENAHPKLKEIARFGAPSNVDAGVYQVLEKLLA